MILIRGSGADARRYLEPDRSRADNYYLGGGTALAEFAVVDAPGERGRGSPRFADPGLGSPSVSSSVAGSRSAIGVPPFRVLCGSRVARAAS